MLRKGNRKSATAYLAAAVILACYLVQTIDCHQLTETESREEADAVKTLVVQEGKIVFGSALENGSDLESQVLNGTQKSSSNASVEAEAAYQGDSTGWSRGQAKAMDSKKASWRQMACSLQCGGDQLWFRAVGPGASHFEVAQGNAPPMPLSQVPSTCGYSMQRNPFLLLMLVPYDGCNVVQKGGNVVLPMRWMGVAVSLWCPKTAAPTTTAKPAATALPQFPYSVYPPYLPPFPWVFQEPLPATAKPITTQNTTTKLESDQFSPYVPLPPYTLFPPHPQYPSPNPERTKKPTTTKKTHLPLIATPLAHHPHRPPQVPLPPTPYPPHLQYPTPKPETMKKPTMATKKTHIPMTATPLAHHPHLPPHVPLPPTPYPPHAQYPYPQYPYPQYPTPKPETIKKPTTATKKNPHIPLTGAPPAHHPHLPPQVPLQPTPYPPHPQYSTPKPTTTKKTHIPLTATPLAHHPHLPPQVSLPVTPYPTHLQYPYHLYLYPQYPIPKPTTATKKTHIPQTGALPAHHPHLPPQVPLQPSPYPPHPQYPYPLYPYPQYPYPQYPTPKPTTTKKTHIPLTATLPAHHPHLPPQVPLQPTPYPPHPQYPYPLYPRPQYPTPKPTTTKKTHIPLTATPPAHHPHLPPQVPLPVTPYPTHLHHPYHQYLYLYPHPQYPIPKPTPATKKTHIPLTGAPPAHHPHLPPQVPLPVTPYPTHLHYPYHQYLYLYPHPQYPIPKPTTATKKTHIPLTGAPPVHHPHLPPQVPLQPTSYPPHPQYPYPQYPTLKPTTTKKTHIPLTATPPAHHPHLPPQFPLPFTPYPYPQYHYPQYPTPKPEMIKKPTKSNPSDCNSSSPSPTFSSPSYTISSSLTPKPETTKKPTGAKKHVPLTAPQPARHPHLPPQVSLPPYPPHPQYPTPKPETTKKPTGAKKKHIPQTAALPGHHKHLPPKGPYPRPYPHPKT